VAGLEGGDEAFSFASGMAAITAALLASLETGDHIIGSSVVYGGTYGILTTFLPRYKIDHTFADIWDLEAVEKAVRKNTKVLWVEPVMNPTLQVADLPALVEIAGRSDVRVIVDNTFTPPYLFQPLNHSAHGVVHSTTKFINGHGDTIGGMVVGPSDWMERVKGMGRLTGGTMSPFNAWLTWRGLRTLGVRLQRACSNAMALAIFLEGHSKVKRIYYPGLDSHPQHVLAARLLADFGCMVSFEVEGGLESVKKINDAFRIITSTVSLGEVDTVAAHPATSSHQKMDPAVREKYGITDGLIRLSVGIEDSEDLKEDLEQALKKC
jgi:methionine-gamma-lyase